MKFPLALVAMILVAGSALAQEGSILNRDIKLPIVIDGKRVGEVAIQAGTRVKVSERKVGKAFVKNGAAEGWVSTAVFVGEEPTPTPAATPQPTSTPAQEPTPRPNGTTEATVESNRMSGLDSASTRRVTDPVGWLVYQIAFIVLVTLLLIYVIKKGASLN